jgi:hypothetical protein
MGEGTIKEFREIKGLPSSFTESQVELEARLVEVKEVSRTCL